jgi:hypothetical protein
MLAQGRRPRNKVKAIHRDTTAVALSCKRILTYRDLGTPIPSAPAAVANMHKYMIYQVVYSAVLYMYGDVTLDVPRPKG